VGFGIIASGVGGDATHPDAVRLFRLGSASLKDQGFPVRQIAAAHGGFGLGESFGELRMLGRRNGRQGEINHE
jgi:hypothetical protein